MMPPKGTPEGDLIRKALEVAVAAPAEQGAYVYSAQIPWGLIHELRAAFVAVGVDPIAVKRGRK